MKIKANNANSPIWKDVYSHSKLPQQLEPLNEIATNLWWVWNHEGAKLFGKIDKQLWKSTEGNPVQLLQSLSHKRMEEILADKELMAEIQKVYADFKAYINVKPDKTQPSVAYFSMEYGLTNVLKIYSGGLGVLAGDYLKEASDSNIDLCAVGFLYRYGYFTQTLSMDGQQIANYEPQNFNALPLTQVLQSNGEPMVLEVPYPGRTVYVHIWKVSVGRIPLYLMDTDIPQNSEWDRSITHQLYGGDWENRMKQEYLLGIGGIAADFENVFNSYIPAGKWILVAFSAAMFLMILIVLVEAVRSWIRLSNIPQDYRTQAEIEAESLVKYGKEAKA